MPLGARAARYWQGYLESGRLPAGDDLPVVTAGPAGGPDLADELLALYLAGTKTAGSSLAEDFRAAGDPLPEVGDHWIVLAGDGEPRCILRTVRVELHPFRDVPEEIAVAEGEGDLSVAHWKRVHAELYAPHLEAWGIPDIDAATVVTQFFEVVLR